MSPYEIPATDLPEPLIAQICNVLGSFSTGVIKIPDRPRGKEEVILLGSGTFVSINGVHGILTAHHVAEKLDLSSSLAVILESKEQKIDIPVNLIRIIEIARGPIESEGPDLSFIQLPPAFVSEIKPYKNFLAHP